MKLSTRPLFAEISKYTTEDLLFHIALHEGWELIGMPNDDGLYLYNKATNKQFYILPYDRKPLSRQLQYHDNWNEQIRLWSQMRKAIGKKVVEGEINEVIEYVSMLGRFEQNFHLAVNENDLEFGLRVIAAQMEFLSEYLNSGKEINLQKLLQTA